MTAEVSASPEHDHPSLHARLLGALDGTEYPAERWEIIAAVAAHGPDAVTTSCLARLPYRSYPDLATVLDAALPTWATRP